MLNLYLNTCLIKFLIDFLYYLPWSFPASLNGHGYVSTVADILLVYEP